ELPEGSGPIERAIWNRRSTCPNLCLDLLTMVMKNAVSGRAKTDLLRLYDELEGKLRALESVGRTQERRFIARRTRPETIYTDNGTNFVGTNSELKNLDWDKIMKETDIKPIKWKFNPPTAAWWGGWKEYLGQLRQKRPGKPGHDFKVGRDGKVRTLKLKCKNSELIRPIQRVYPLEVPFINNEIVKIDGVPTSSVNEDKLTRSARKGRLDLRFASSRYLEMVCGTIAMLTSARIVERVTVGSTSACRTILRSSLLVVFLGSPDPVFHEWVPSRDNCSHQFLTATLNDTPG
ncbi:uncharacterized protein TNCV_4545051, partial [Trichonephila clavipes]